LTAEQVVEVADGSGQSFVFIADRFAITNREHPVLVVDLVEEPGRTFRVVPSEAWGVENNLSLANMDSKSSRTRRIPTGFSAASRRPESLS